MSTEPRPKKLLEQVDDAIRLMPWLRVPPSSPSSLPRSFPCPAPAAAARRTTDLQEPADGRRFAGSTVSHERIGQFTLAPGYYTFVLTLAGDTIVVTINQDAAP